MINRDERTDYDILEAFAKRQPRFGRGYGDILYNLENSGLRDIKSVDSSAFRPLLRLLAQEIVSKGKKSTAMTVRVESFLRENSDGKISDLNNTIYAAWVKAGVLSLTDTPNGSELGFSDVMMRVLRSVNLSP